MKKSQIIAVAAIAILLLFILINISNNSKTITTNLKTSCECFNQGYNSGFERTNNISGCYKGHDGKYNIRKAYNEGLWHGKKSAQGISPGLSYYNSRRQYCGD